MITLNEIVTSPTLIPTDVLFNIVLFGKDTQQSLKVLSMGKDTQQFPKTRPPCVEPWTLKSIEFYT